MPSPKEAGMKVTRNAGANMRWPSRRWPIGDYRAVYEVLLESKVIEIARVRQRKDVYG